MSRIYVIVDSSEAVNFNFDQLVDIDESYSRKSLDDSKILARFEGDTPAFLQGKTQYTRSEILDILATEEWSDNNII